jgi:uncharacterized protein YaiI (UPF0178 family)
MQIWVDADACPGVVKQILYRAAERAQVRLTLVANRHLSLPRSPYIRAIQVARGFDVADRRIAESMQPGDLIVTADVPLAADVVEKGGLALNPRGELYTEENIGEHLAMRNLMDELRSGGMEVGGPAAFDKTDRQAFANQLDRLLSRSARK